MIELKVDDFLEGKVSFHIERQDEEDYKRLSQQYFPFEINGTNFVIVSGAYPSFYSEDKHFFVRGNIKEEDYRRIRVSIAEYLNIFELVKKYNEKFFKIQKVIYDINKDERKCK